MNYTDHRFDDYVGGIAVQCYGHVDLDSWQIIFFSIHDGPNDVTDMVEQYNSAQFNLLLQRLVTEVQELHKPEGADL